MPAPNQIVIDLHGSKPARGVELDALEGFIDPAHLDRSST